MQAARRGFDLEPLSLLANQIRGWVSFFAGRIEEALAQATHLLSLDPSSGDGHSMAIACNEVLGRLDRSAEEWRRGIPFFGWAVGHPTRMADALTAGGPAAYWEARLSLVREHRSELRGAARVAEAIPLTYLGRADEAVALLEETVELHHPHAVFLGVDPFAIVLRQHPRFRALLAKVGLPTAD
jgi:hypothetical protein